MANCIDLHNHILRAIDDGPQTLNESVMLARAMVKIGFDTVVATPHSCEGKPPPSFIHKRIKELQDELICQQVPLKILPGAEQHIEPQTLSRLLDKEILTLNGSRYLLLELPMMQPLPVYTEDLIFRLVDHGYQPVIPHPERVVVLQQHPDLIYRLYKAGAIFQVTWGALNGSIGPAAEETVRIMIEADLAHLFSTDAHNFSTRLLAVKNAAEILENIYGSGAAELMLSTRPRRLIANQDLNLPPASKPSARPKGIYSLLSKLRRR